MHQGMVFCCSWRKIMQAYPQREHTVQVVGFVKGSPLTGFARAPW